MKGKRGEKLRPCKKRSVSKQVQGEGKIGRLVYDIYKGGKLTEGGEWKERKEKKNGP